MRSVLVRLYPARWRDRYGEEFQAVLEERPLGSHLTAETRRVASLDRFFAAPRRPYVPSAY